MPPLDVNKMGSMDHEQVPAVPEGTSGSHLYRQETVINILKQTNKQNPTQ